MSTGKRDVWLVYAQFGLLLAITALADRPLIRVGLVFAVGLLLVQHATTAVGLAASLKERRRDPAVRDAVSRLLDRIREFYAACSLARSGQIPADDAVERIRRIEKDLDGLLDEVIRTSQGVPQPEEAKR